jgi:hypothetical protein
LHVGVLHHDESVVHLIGTGAELDEEDLSLLGEDEVVGVGDVEGLAVDGVHHLGDESESLCGGSGEQLVELNLGDARVEEGLDGALVEVMLEDG